MNYRLRTFLLPLAPMAMGFIAGASCDKVAAAANALAEQCGLVCPATGVAEGNATISGIASVDAFFGSVVRFNGSVDAVSDGLRVELDGIATSVGLQPGAAAADIQGAITTKLKANVQGNLTIKAEPPKCTVSAKATLQAQANCSGTVVPPMATVDCQGSCDVKAGVMVDCGASAKLSCTGTAPNLACSGSCKGACDLKVAAMCSGTCQGTCNGMCNGQMNSATCNGTCSGTCQGSCQLSAGGTCSGSCSGECTYTPPSAMCEASAQAHCDAMANASVKCSGTCSGSVTPPSVKAECDASAKADASVSAECKPPSLSVDFTLTATVAGDATASGQFTAWLEGFKGHIANILAIKAKLAVVAAAGADLKANAQTAISASISSISTDASVKVAVGVTCATAELPKAIALVSGAVDKLTASTSDTVTVLGSVSL